MARWGSRMASILISKQKADAQVRPNVEEILERHRCAARVQAVVSCRSGSIRWKVLTAFRLARAEIDACYARTPTHQAISDNQVRLKEEVPEILPADSACSFEGCLRLRHCRGWRNAWSQERAVNVSSERWLRRMVSRENPDP